LARPVTCRAIRSAVRFASVALSVNSDRPNPEPAAELLRHQGPLRPGEQLAGQRMGVGEPVQLGLRQPGERGTVDHGGERAR
jgi:hypothetical protein